MEPSWSHLGPTRASSIQKVAKISIFDPPRPPQLVAKIEQKSLKRRSQSSCFLTTFFGTVFSATWCQLGLNLVPKTYPNRRQVGSQVASSKQIGKIGKMCTAPRRELDFQGFWGPKLARKAVKKSLKIGSATGRKLGWVLDSSWYRFWTIWGASGEPRWAQKC